MLITLTIKNIALIDCAEIKFTDGLNVLSGETGAGKSVIIESLNFVLGAKADKTLIRSGESECFVKAEFNVTNRQTIKDALAEFEIEYDDTLIISRKFSLDGKSTVKVNGETVTVSMLKKLTSNLVDVHGQSEHFSLLKASNQLALIDKFGSSQVTKLKDKIYKEYSEYKNVCAKIAELGGDESQRLIRLDVLKFQINEIENCALKENEEEELLEIRQKLSCQEKISTALLSVKSAINDEGGLSDVLGNTLRILSGIANLSAEYNGLYERLNSVYAELDDIGDGASGLLDDFDFSTYNPDQIEFRLETIKGLKKKYGNDYQEIYDYLEKAKEEFDRLENFNEVAQKLLDEKLSLEKTLYKNYCELSKQRRISAKEFSDNVLIQLKELGMPKATFEVQFNEVADFEQCKFDSANGFDSPEFMFSANLGEPPKSLSNIISGGEMSRFMLAIKTQTAKYNEISTFIFDEIDAGISGVIAKVVGEKFVKISKSVQIIAISHLAQISVMADNNLLIEKTEGDGKTVTSVKTLDYDAKVKEITRLIGGSIESDSAIKHAKELLSDAEKFKLSI